MYVEDHITGGVQYCGVGVRGGVVENPEGSPCLLLVMQRWIQGR